MSYQSVPARRIVTALAACLATGLVLSARAAAQQSPEPPSSATEAITVHGHWVIEVRNPDGTLATRREFNNALLPQGGASLAQLLGRSISMGLWRVRLDSTSGDGPCDAGGAAALCLLQEPSDSETLPTFYKTLAVEVSEQNELVLRGTATAQRDGEIDLVHARLFRCTPDLPPNDPASCQQTLGNVFRGFTETTLGSPVSVATGQVILVTVTMSFS